MFNFVIGITFGSIFLCGSMMLVEYYDTKLGIAAGIVSSGSGEICYKILFLINNPKKINYKR